MEKVIGHPSLQSGGKFDLPLWPSCAANADQLARLYDGLSDDDRYRRFFSLYRPDRATIERWAADNDQGKLRLAAFVDGGATPGHPELVGDALCVRLPDGDGEFALAVAAGWRGWLGAYLLAALAEVAAGMGRRRGGLRRRPWPRCQRYHRGWSSWVHGLRTDSAA